MSQETITPQQAMYDDGVELAYKVNASYDRRSQIAEERNVCREDSLMGYGPKFDKEAQLTDQYDNEQKLFDAYSKAVGALIGPKPKQISDPDNYFC